MPLTFHWFLPANGDSRDIVGGGHGVATGAAGAIGEPSVQYLGQIARGAEQLGFAGAHRDRRVVRGRLPDLRAAHRGNPRVRPHPPAAKQQGKVNTP